MRRVGMSRLACLVCGVAALATACWSDDETPAPDVIAHESCGADGCDDEDALIEAELTVAHECVYLLTPDDAPAIVPVFPPGTTWDMDRTVVVLPGGAIAAMGERISGGGGFGRADEQPATESERNVLERVRHCIAAGDVDGRPVDEQYWDFQANEILVVAPPVDLST